MHVSLADKITTIRLLLCTFCHACTFDAEIMISNFSCPYGYTGDLCEHKLSHYETAESWQNWYTFILNKKRRNNFFVVTVVKVMSSTGSELTFLGRPRSVAYI